jgi:hypothetical protein
MRDGLTAYKKGFAKRVAAFAVVFVIGTIAGAFLLSGGGSSDALRDWEGQAATYHAGDASRSETTFAIPQDWPVGAYDGLNPSIDWVFDGASLLMFDQVPVVRLDYTHTNKALISHYMSETLNADLSEPVVGLRDGLQAATWTKGGFEYLLIGDTDATVIWEIAKALASH